MELLRSFYHDKAPGLLVAGMIAVASVFLSSHYGGPTMLFALLLGIALNFLSDHERCVDGINLASKNILRIGVAMLGFRISFDAVIGLGIGPVVLVICSVIATIILGLILTRDTDASSAFGCLSGGSVAICGASAAMALSSVLPQNEDNERNTIFTVITVTALSTIAMVFYPMIAALLGLDEQQTGIFLGATIHDVAQVVGAGYGVSDQAGDISTIVKLLRVAMLLPVVLVVMMVVRINSKKARGGAAKLPFPWFVLGFVALVTLNSMVAIPAEISTFFIDLSRWCIVAAVAALGMKTSFGALVKVGYFPVAVIVAETVFLACLCLAAIFLFEM
ncbi:putative sulfate exporter family transporter [Terasakiella sp. A23]|uniref:YeiH family protein n=1 Tax=Terasakiella sp. FCG-A23 TaxID=3080561 RepID=UPI0029545DE9|nr:putative sulfate exporter family transporter [Terasakiella sp. A23]MDV7341604.1 putative sulfate exporter family transporter [Terasakiella sp. A23]